MILIEIMVILGSCFKEGYLVIVVPKCKLKQVGVCVEKVEDKHYYYIFYIRVCKENFSILLAYKVGDRVGIQSYKPSVASGHVEEVFNHILHISLSSDEQMGKREKKEWDKHRWETEEDDEVGSG